MLNEVDTLNADSITGDYLFFARSEWGVCHPVLLTSLTDRRCFGVLVV